MKLEIRSAIQKFNFKPDQGISHLISIGYVKADE